MRNLYVETDVLAKQPARKGRHTINRQPLQCGVCGELFDACDREISELARMRHIRTVHQIPRCSPDFYD